MMLMNGNFINRNLQVALLESEDKPSERLVSIEAPKEPPHGWAPYIIDAKSRKRWKELEKGRGYNDEVTRPPRVSSRTRTARRSSVPAVQVGSKETSPPQSPTSQRAIPRSRRAISTNATVDTRRSSDAPPGEDELRLSYYERESAASATSTVSDSSEDEMETEFNYTLNDYVDYVMCYLLYHGHLSSYSTSPPIRWNPATDVGKITKNANQVQSTSTPPPVNMEQARKRLATLRKEPFKKVEDVLPEASSKRDRRAQGSGMLFIPPQSSGQTQSTDAAANEVIAKDPTSAAKQSHSKRTSSQGVQAPVDKSESAKTEEASNGRDVADIPPPILFSKRPVKPRPNSGRGLMLSNKPDQHGSQDISPQATATTNVATPETSKAVPGGKLNAQNHAHHLRPKSSLTVLLTSSSPSGPNPFSVKHAKFVGTMDSKAIQLKIFLPFSQHPELPGTSVPAAQARTSRPGTGAPPFLEISVKHDVTVEQVIGFTLYRYFEEKRLPTLTSQQTDLRNWTMRIVEDDGSIDEDFPALERTRRITKFAFDQFALCEDLSKANTSPSLNIAVNSQNTRIEKNQEFGTDKDISGMQTSNKAENQTGRGVTSPKTRGYHSSASSSTAVQGSNAVPPTPGIKPIFIRVHLYSTIDVRHTTTLSVAATTSMGEILGMVCRKRNVDRRDYVLKLMDLKEEVTLDTTVAELDGINELCLVKKATGLSAGDVFIRPPGEERESTENNDVEELPSGSQLAMAYKKYTVTRKLPMFVGRLERELAIDGEYIHLLRQEQKHLFDSGQTHSYHVSNVIKCKLGKAPASFRLVVSSNGRSGDAKTYDFEASNVAEAEDICNRIAALKTMLQT